MPRTVFPSGTRMKDLFPKYAAVISKLLLILRVLGAAAASSYLLDHVEFIRSVVEESVEGVALCGTASKEQG